MPEKQRYWTSSQNANASITSLLRDIHVWHADCQRPPHILEAPAGHDWSDPDVEVISASEWIKYGVCPKESSFLDLLGHAINPAANPTRIRPQNFCHHLYSVRKSEPGDAFTGAYRHEDVYTYPYLGCGPYQFTGRTVTQTKAVSWGSFEQVFSSALPPGIIMNDPWLPLGTNEFQQKLEVLDGMALDAMIPQLGTGFSISVFLAELTDLDSMLKGLFNLLKNLPAAARRLLNAPLKSGSNAWLATIFGWLPFFSDLQTIYTKLLNLDDIIDKFLEGANKRKTLYFQKALSPYTFRDPLWFNSKFDHTVDFSSSFPGFGEFNEMTVECNRDRTIAGPVFHACMDYQYNIPFLNEILTRFLAGADVLGLHPSLKDVWAIMPLSFVVDWFWSVSSWLSQFDLKALPVEVVIYDFSRSFKYRLIEKVTPQTVLSLVNDSNIEEDLSEWTFSPVIGALSRETRSYYRLPGLPRLVGPNVHARLPKGWKLVTGGALIRQRLPRGRR